MVAGGEHCQLRAAIEVLVPYSHFWSLTTHLAGLSLERTTGFEPATLTLAINRGYLPYLAKYK
jgi:hypothetical protein